MNSINTNSIVGHYNGKYFQFDDVNAYAAQRNITDAKISQGVLVSERNPNSRFTKFLVWIGYLREKQYSENEGASSPKTVLFKRSDYREWKKNVANALKCEHIEVKKTFFGSLPLNEIITKVKEQLKKVSLESESKPPIVSEHVELTLPLVSEHVEPTPPLSIQVMAPDSSSQQAVKPLKNLDKITPDNLKDAPASVLLRTIGRPYDAQRNICEPGEACVEVANVQHGLDDRLTLTEANLPKIFKLANQYTTNTPYRISPQSINDRSDALCTIKGVPLYRYHHNGTHSARQVRGLEAVIDLIQKQASPEKQAIFKSFREEEKTNLKLAAYLMRAGRLDERGWQAKDPYAKRSAEVYAAYAQQLGVDRTLIDDTMLAITDACKHDKFDPRVLSDPKIKMAYELLSTLHEMDLVRQKRREAFFEEEGTSFVELQNRLVEILGKDKTIVSPFIKTLFVFASNLCTATGIDTHKDDTLPVGDGQLFIDCSQDGQFCWNAVSKVPLPQWTEPARTTA